MSSAPIEQRPAAAAPKGGPGLGAWIKQFLPRTLLWRAVFIIAVPVVLVQIFAALLFFEPHFSALSRDLSRAVAGDIALVIEQMERRSEARQQIFEDAARTLELAIAFEPGAQLEPFKGPSWNPWIEPILNTALEERVNRPFTVGRRAGDDRVEIRVQLPDGVLDVLSPSHRLFNSTALVFLAWVIGLPFLLTPIALIFMRNQVRPIRRLAIAAEGFGKGRDTVRLRPQGALEVRQAAAAFIVMRDRIRRQIVQRTEMLAGVSHDLRTPLTRMKLQLALLGEGEGVEELRADVAEMQGMIDAYLAFARGEGTEPPQLTDLGQMIREIVGGLPGGEAVALDIESPIEIPVQPVAMKRCIGNLVANALRYGKRVKVTAGWRGRTAVVIVDDDGPGIHYDKREEVFRPFVRLDPSRNIATGGVGLGLTIARDIAHSHGGEINLEDSPMGGLQAVLTLPG